MMNSSTSLNDVHKQSDEILALALQSVTSTQPLSLTPHAYHQIHVHTAKELYGAVQHANILKGNVVILLAEGRYKITKTLFISQPNIWIMSESNDPAKTVLFGTGMIQAKEPFHLFLVASSGVVIQGLTLEKASHHLIQIQGEKNADFFVLRNSILRDSYQQLVKVTSGKESYAAHGLIENCIFNYSAGVGPNWYIGGIDAHGAENWVVQNNLFMNISSPGKQISEHAVHFWDYSKNNTIHSNVFVNNDRAIGFGMKLKSRANRKYDNTGGKITNNIIFHNDNSLPFSDVGIIIELSPSTIVQSNIIYHKHAYPNSIEYRYSGTNKVIIRGNISNRRIMSRNGAKAEVSNNELLSDELLYQRIKTTLTTLH